MMEFLNSDGERRCAGCGRYVKAGALQPNPLTGAFKTLGRAVYLDCPPLCQGCIKRASTTGV